MEKKKVSSRAAICAFCIAAASNFGFSIVYAYTQYYVGIQTATGFTNTQLGLLLTVLGIASTILYLPGGFLADKFDPLKLMTIGLIGAGAVGFFIAQFPSYPIMMALYVIWPVFAILIAWNPQIKVLRLISEDDEQAKIQTIRAYGRTLPILIISFVGSGLLARMQEAEALKFTLYLYGACAIICAIIAAITYKPVQSQLAAASEKSINLKEYGQVLKMPEVWAIGLIGFCTYIASTGVTYLQPFLASIYNLDASTSSIYAIIAKNCALVAAPIMTWIATKKKVPVTKVLGFSLLIAAVCFVLFIIFPQNANLLVLAIVLYMAAALCIMATWAMQFTPVSEVGIPMAVTGSAIGVISMFSFVSDIFYSAVCGFFIDNYDLNGYKWIFGMTTVLLVIGALAAFYIVRKIKAKAQA
ncbi:MAG: MFS transporter [Firmicutes bacterium]|nr:MFS transporter [Bacillota bacterium]